MEEKVLVGNQVIEEAKKQAIELKKTKKILNKEKMERDKLEEKKWAKETELLDMNKKFSTLQEELEYITQKLNKVWEKY